MVRAPGSGEVWAEGIATRGHVVVLVEGDRVLLVREVRSGSVRYLAPEATVRADETPGKAAVRAAREHLCAEVTVTDLLFADTEMGAEHFFFVAELESEYQAAWDAEPPQSDGTMITAVRRSALLAYPVRPVELARRLMAHDRSRAEGVRTN